MQNSLLKTLLLVLALSGMSACSFRGKAREEAAAKKVAEDLKNKDLQIEEAQKIPTIVFKDFPKISALPLIPDDRPKYYKVVFQWGAEGQYQYTVKAEGAVTSSYMGSSNHQSTLSTTTKNLFLLYNTPGEKTITFNYYDLDGNFKTDDIVKIPIPEDIEANSEKAQLVPTFTFDTDKKSIHRFFLGENFKWHLNGGELIIKADQIIIKKGARIINFADRKADEKSSIYPDGRGGGHVYLHASSATGLLKLDLRGQDGAPGYSGSPIFTTAADGLNGTPGAGENEEALCPGEKKCVKMKAFCTRQPTNGTPGANGITGNPGKNGGHGGDSGTFAVELGEKSNLIVRYDMTGGIRGAGGEGSAGQAGGKGGAPGEQGHKACNMASPGPNGIAGQPGANGSPGFNGTTNLPPDTLLFKHEKLSPTELLEISK